MKEYNYLVMVIKLDAMYAHSLELPTEQVKKNNTKGRSVCTLPIYHTLLRVYHLKQLGVEVLYSFVLKSYDLNLRV